MNANLEGKSYNDADCRDWSEDIATEVREAIKSELNVPRYKIVVQASIGEMKDQGVKVASRCLWAGGPDKGTDNYASASFKNESLWASVVVWALYCE